MSTHVFTYTTINPPCLPAEQPPTTLPIVATRRDASGTWHVEILDKQGNVLGSMQTACDSFANVPVIVAT